MKCWRLHFSLSQHSEGGADLLSLAAFTVHTLKRAGTHLQLGGLEKSQVKFLSQGNKCDVCVCIMTQAGFEPATLRLRIRAQTTWPPRPLPVDCRPQQGGALIGR